MIVLDTSTLILLAKTDLLPLLIEEIAVHIPEGINQEALAKPDAYDAKVIQNLISQKKIKVHKNAGANAIKQIQADFNMQPGETEALTLAQRKKYTFGTDDSASIKAAKIMNLPFTTAIDILVVFHEKEKLSRQRALAKLDDLQRLGRYGTPIIEFAMETIKGKRGEKR